MIFPSVQLTLISQSIVMFQDKTCPLADRIQSVRNNRGCKKTACGQKEDQVGELGRAIPQAAELYYITVCYLSNSHLPS